MLTDVIASVAPAWLADAEISVPLSGGDGGLSFFFEADGEFADFLDAVAAPRLVRDCEVRLRGRFDLVPRRWVKVQGEASSRRFSQYFQITPRNTYPVTTLRLFLRSFGVTDVAWLEEGLSPALERDDTVWGLVLKHGPAGVAPRLSVRTVRRLLPALLQRLEDAGRLAPALRSAYADLALAVPGDDPAYLSFDPGAAGACALDFEHVPAAAVPGAAAVLPEVPVLRYAKCRLAGGGRPPAWTAYLPYPAWRTCSQPSPGGPRSRVAEARAHYERHNAAILASFGGTYQAGWLLAGNAPASAQASNLELARRAGLSAGERVLDAGCGRGGPACDIAEAIPGIRIDGVVLSPAEAASARHRARVRRCEDRFAVIAADYHALPVADARYDVALFLESLGYAFDLPAVCAELRRVVRRGGRVYVKDVFLREGAVTEEARVELAEFDRTFAQCTRTRADVAAAFERAGFRLDRNASFGEVVSMDHFKAAMFAAPGRLSSFGREHFRRFRTLPVEYGEIGAAAP